MSSKKPSLTLSPNVRITRLENGVVVASEALPLIRSASLGVYLDIGSRDEVPGTNGLAHLFEHMVFKGTTKHTALEIVQCFEATGGQVNAYTSKEQTCFYAKVVDTEVETGLSMLLEMVLDSTFVPEELKKEKEVIVEEIKGGNDNPEDFIYDLFSEAYFARHSLGFPIAGTAKTVRGLQRAHLVDHQARAVRQLPLFVVAVGRVKHADIVDLARKAFGLGTSSRGAGRATARKAARRPGHILRPAHLLVKRPVQQVTALLGGPGYDWDHANRYALLLLNTVLGDGMSSKLFQSVREAHGLVYNIYSNPEFLINAGLFAIGFATEAGDLPKAVREINAQLRELKKSGLKQEELDFAKRNLRGGILLGLESTNTRMATLSRRIMYGQPDEGVEDILRRLDLVTLPNVRRAIADVFRAEKWATAGIVPKKSKIALKKLLDF